MTPEKINELIGKMKEGTATSEEELMLLKFVNQGVEELRLIVKELAVEDKIANLKNKLSV